MILPKQVTLCEVGTRDGLQKATILPTAEKIKLINMITDAGYKMIEIGSVVTGSLSYAQANDTVDVFKAINKKPGTTYRVLVSDPDDIRICAEIGVELVKITLSASEAHNHAEMQMTTRESVSKLLESGPIIRETGLKMMGSISMPFNSPWEGIIPMDTIKFIIDSYVEAGACMISLSDTSGSSDPKLIYDRIMQLKEMYPDMRWVSHFHNTRGLGLANVLAAMQAGVTDIDSSFAGTGGCPFIEGAKGNISSEDVLFMLNSMGIETGVDYQKVLDLGKYVKEHVNVPTNSYQLDLLDHGETLVR